MKLKRKGYPTARSNTILNLKSVLFCFMLSGLTTFFGVVIKDKKVNEKVCASFLVPFISIATILSF